MVYNRCNPNFQSQYAYLDNQETLTINDYLNKPEKVPIFCNKGHELVAVNSKNRKKHFRHKNKSDMDGHPMTEWHAEWQGNFPVTEISFPKTFPTQVRERRADVVINDKIILELQHSTISAEEVFSRKNDYSLHGKDIIWLIDGNRGVEVNELNGTKRCFLYFSSDLWRYKSFDQYSSIYLDINEKIYKICPSKVKSDMTDVAEPKSKSEFIEALKNSKDLWNNYEPPQCELFVKQQGAGNGKTFGIIQSIKDPAFSHYKTFIYVTKQHSAKYVMFKELEQQIEGTEYLAPQFTDYECINKTGESVKDSKKYIYEITHKETGDKKQIIFATIDSFMFSVGHSNKNAYDTFLGIVNNIISDNDVNNLKIENSSINFAKKQTKLNKETLFIVDECQDLAIEYARAIIKVMRTTYMDCLVVGDILQSIHHENNAFRFFMSNTNDNEIIPFIRRIKMEPSNICQRFKKIELVDFVNKIVNFNYNGLNLPNVSVRNPINNTNDSIIFFTNSNVELDNTSVSASEEDGEKEISQITENINNIMNHFEKEVYENNRKPNDFLFITPFTSNNLLAQELELRIHMFWDNYFNETPSNDFVRYAIFHRSQEGTSINLAESDNATRIVSCHSSKGDGRNVVFLIGFTEKNINVFSKRTDSLIFESMVNVAMTRMKDKLFIEYKPNGDILHTRYAKYCQSIDNRIFDVIPLLPEINKYMPISKLIDYFDGDENWNFFSHIKQKAKITTGVEEYSNKKIIDMTHHSIRAQLMDMRFMISIILQEKNMKNDFRKKQQLRIFEDIEKSTVKYVYDYKTYSELVIKLCNPKIKSKVYPILMLRGRTKDGIPYYEVLNNFFLNMIEYTRQLNRIPCPFECLILYFMKEILRNGQRSDISIFSLYDILDKYEHGFQDDTIHKECACRKYFKQTNQNLCSDVFHVNFYDKLNIMNDNLLEIYRNNPKLAWLSNQKIYFNGGNSDFVLCQNIKYHGYDDEKNEILLCYLKPQHNDLNEKDTYMKIIMDTWLLLNYKQNDNNIVKYYGKKIRACIISLDSNIPIYIDFENIIKENNSNILQLVFDRYTQVLSQTNESIYYFYNYYRSKMINNKNINDFCKILCRQIKDTQDNHNNVKFIRDFFIGYLSIDNNKLSTKIKNSILEEYDNKEKFIEDLQGKINQDIADYLEVQIEEQEIIEE